MDLSAILTTILTYLFVSVAVLMTFLILLQEGKGGGLAALGGTKAAGVEGVTNPVRRFTAYLAAIFFVLAVILGLLARRGLNSGAFEYDKPAVGSALKLTESKKPPSPLSRLKPPPIKIDKKSDARPKAVPPAETKAEVKTGVKPEVEEMPKAESKDETKAPAKTGERVEPKAEEKTAPKAEEKKSAAPAEIKPPEK